MDGGKNKGKRTEESERVIQHDLNDFERIRQHLTDIVSNKSFKNKIISPEDREFLRKFLREIKDVIHDIETVPSETFDIVSKQNLTERKTHARKEYQRVMTVLNDDGSVLKNEEPNKVPLALSSGLQDSEKTSVKSTNSLNSQFHINTGYESDSDSVHCDGKTILKIENKMDGSYKSSASTDSNKKSDQVFFYNKPELYGGSSRYFIDDYEAASTISVTSGDNWTFKKSTLSMNTENEDRNMQSNQQYHFRDTKIPKDISRNVGKPSFGNSENKVPINSTLFRDQSDKPYENDYDDTVTSPAADKKYNNTDVDDALGDFDYLDEYQSQSDASNVSLYGSNTSIGSVEKKFKNNGHKKNAYSLDDKERNLDTQKDNTNVNDVLGVFDYLNEYHSRTNSTSTASLYDSNDDNDLDKENILAENNGKNIVDRLTENDKTKLDFDKGNSRKKTRVDHDNVRNKTNDVLPQGFTGYGPLGSAVELNPDYENDFDRPIKSKSKNVEMKNSHTDVVEKRSMDDKSYINIAYGIEDKGIRPFQDTYPAYESNRKPDKAVFGKRNVLDRAKSEEAVSGYTHGEFILRRTQSEDQKGAFRQKPITPLEVVPENQYPSAVYDDSVEYSRKTNPVTKSFDKCDFLINFAIFILFGIGVAVIIFGILLREDCQWEETVTVCTIASGGVTICYCAIFLLINMSRKRKIEMSRFFRVLLVIIWLMLLGLIVAGAVLMYPSIRDYAFTDCGDEQDCCRRKLTLVTFCAITVDIVCQICFVVGLCCVH